MVPEIGQAKVALDLPIYVNADTNSNASDDLPVIPKDANKHNLVIGTDYGHHDTSSQIEALRMLPSEGSVPTGIVDKILGDNARALYDP